MSGSPRAFEPQRLLQPLRANARAWAGIAVVALFAGAAMARLAIPNELIASGALRVARDAHLAVREVRAPDLLEEARGRAANPTSARALGERLSVRFRAPDRLLLELRATDDEQRVRRTLDAVLALYIERANARRDAELRARQHQHQAEGGQLRRAYAAARAQRNAALVREGYPDLDRALLDTRAQLVALERETEQTSARAAESQAKLPLSERVGRAPETLPAGGQLAEAQRALSRLLAEQGDRRHPEVVAAEQRLAQLQAHTLQAANVALRERQALAGRSRELDARLARTRAELEGLQAVRSSLAPLFDLEARARESLERHEGESLSAQPTPAAVSQKASVRREGRTALRTLASLLVPAIALLALLGLVVVRELRAFRVCAPTELAYWSRAPVLSSSAWPRSNEALEGLVDELASPALAARGIVLVLPLSELERPLAGTLAAQLNSRAQRLYRSSTGSRVTIAQPWLGELGGARVKRAAAAADRVLWVVAADSHRGWEIRQCAAQLGRRDRIAAVLVDAEPSFRPAIGSAREFWSARPSEGGVVGAPSAAQ